MGGVGLSEIEDIIKHTIPHIFVSVVAQVIWPRGMQVKLGSPEDNRQLIIWGKVKIAGEKRNKSVLVQIRVVLVLPSCVMLKLVISAISSLF